MQTDRFIQRSQKISRKIECARVEYPTLWRRILRHWQQTDGYDAVWLTYSANYLLRTAGVRWALDPLSLFSRIGEGQQPDFVNDLHPLQLVVLSHAHNDHFDRTLIRAISALPITWVVPSFMVDDVIRTANLPRERIIIPKAGCPIHFGPLTLNPFEAQHFRETNGVPEMGYTAEFSGKRWLFPGDTRTYDIGCIPHEVPIDGVFAHLWLGKARAMDENPQLLNDFCLFFTALNPKQIIVSHLEEFGRTAENFWTLQHYQKTLIRFQEIKPQIRVSAALMGQHIIL